MKSLVLITARKGSKGVWRKNSKLLAGKSLVSYTIEYAMNISSPKHICVSTDDQAIIEIAEGYGIDVPFIRPKELSSDTATSYDVMLHALDFFEQKGIHFDNLILLQPTSPFRKEEHLIEAMKLYSKEIDLVLSVCVTKANPYHVLFEENKLGFIERSKNLNTSRRQDVPIVYQANGSIYIFNTTSLRKYNSLNEFNKIVKFEMPHLFSVDIDDESDWDYCEYLIEKGLV